jgi:hypothetical protein
MHDSLDGKRVSKHIYNVKWRCLPCELLIIDEDLESYCVKPIITNNYQRSHHIDPAREKYGYGTATFERLRSCEERDNKARSSVNRKLRHTFPQCPKSHF